MRGGLVRHPLLFGLLGGLTWGVLLRAWMRWISTDPDFTWGGTGFILGASAIVGGAMGLAWLRRERHGRGWWRLLGATSVLVASGAGIVMAPSFLLGAVAFGRTTWPRWVRVVLAVVAAALQVAFFIGEPLPAGRGLLAYPWYAVLLTIEAYALSVVVRPSVHAVVLPASLRRVVVAGAGTAAVMTGVLITGVGRS